MVLVATPVKDDLRNTFFNRPFANQFADLCRCVGIPRALKSLAKLGFNARGSDQSVSSRIVDNLRVNVAQAAEDRKTRPLRRALYFLAHPKVPALPCHSSILNRH